MTYEQPDLFAAVDALLAQAEPDALPDPHERRRLREAAGVDEQQLAATLRVSIQDVEAWESGRAQPRPPQRAAYARFLDALAPLHPPAPAHTPAPQAPAAPRQTAATDPASAQASAPTHSAVPAQRAGHGPLAVLDGDEIAYLSDGTPLHCPATTLSELVNFTLHHTHLGASRLHRYGKDSDPLIVLTASATTRFGLPLLLEDRRSLRLPDDHPAVTELVRENWQLTRRGFGPWPRIYRPTNSRQRQCVQLAILPWDAFEARSWDNIASFPPAQLAQALGDYAHRVLTPRGSTAVNGQELMTALRPPTRPVKDPATGTWHPGRVPGSLTAPHPPAPPEAPAEHPAAVDRHDSDVLDEEAYDWVRDPDLISEWEFTQAFAVGLDINTAFLAATNGLTVGLGPATHVRHPEFDPKTPGCWLADLSHIPQDPRLPSPFTPDGHPPQQPAWYATPTLAYAYELGFSPEPLQAWIRPKHGPYLSPWYTHLRNAYIQTMAALGVTTDLDAAQYLDAMTRHTQQDPGQAAVLRAIKATVKGGIGKLRERPQGAHHRPGQPWPALDRPTWRPDIRAAVISKARTNMHRKIQKLAAVSPLPPRRPVRLCRLSQRRSLAAGLPSPDARHRPAPARHLPPRSLARHGQTRRNTAHALGSRPAKRRRQPRPPHPRNGRRTARRIGEQARGTYR